MIQDENDRFYHTTITPGEENRDLGNYICFINHTSTWRCPTASFVSVFLSVFLCLCVCVFPSVYIYIYIFALIFIRKCFVFLLRTFVTNGRDLLGCLSGWRVEYYMMLLFLTQSTCCLILYIYNQCKCALLFLCGLAKRNRSLYLSLSNAFMCN